MIYFTPLMHISVLLKVLAVPVDSPNSTLTCCTSLKTWKFRYKRKRLLIDCLPAVYQKALLTSELEEIFANAPAAATASIQHNGLQKAWAEATGSPVKETAASAGKRREPKDDDACPIVSAAGPFHTRFHFSIDLALNSVSKSLRRIEEQTLLSIVKPRAVDLSTNSAWYNGITPNLMLLVYTAERRGPMQLEGQKLVLVLLKTDST